MRALVLVPVLLAGLALPAAAGDAAGRRVLGFSPDGRHFAFEQYWAVYEDEASVSEIHVIDTVQDQTLTESPIRVRIEGEDGLEPDKARSEAARRAKPLLERVGTREPARIFAATPSRAVDATDHYQLADPFSPAIDIVMPDAAPARIEVKAVPLGHRTCVGGDRSRTPTRVAVSGYELRLAVAGKAPQLLHADRGVPKSRGCPVGYGVAEAYLHAPAGKAATLVVLLEYADADDGHAGPNRRFLAVAHRP